MCDGEPTMSSTAGYRRRRTEPSLSFVMLDNHVPALRDGQKVAMTSQEQLIGERLR